MMQWAVKLAGSYQPYEPHVSSAIEAAHQAGDDRVDVVVGGKEYIITFAEPMKQQLKSDPTKHGV